MRMKDKVALVSGAAGGMGAATARLFAREGAKAVVVADLLDKEGEAVVADINKAGGKASYAHLDVTDEGQWKGLIDRILADHGHLDVLVNNAGIAVLGMMDTVSTADWQRQIDVNLTSVFQGARRAMAMMRRAGSDGKARGGAIINISSVAGLIGVPGCASYAASKGGVRLLTKVVALEGATDGIRCNSVHPGMIATNIQGVALEDNAANYDATMALIPMGYMGAPEDIANMNLFLASDEARYITGAEMVVDGGMTAR